jgi:hypothetical protein
MSEDFDRFMAMADISRELGVLDPGIAIVSQRIFSEGECTGRGRR